MDPNALEIPCPACGCDTLFWRPSKPTSRESVSFYNRSALVRHIYEHHSPLLALMDDGSIKCCCGHLSKRESPHPPSTSRNILAFHHIARCPTFAQRAEELLLISTLQRL